MVRFLLLAIAFLFLRTIDAVELNPRIREAGHPATSVERMSQLVTDDDWMVREALGRNRRSPPSVLERLAVDPDPRVRIAVATNLATPEWLHLRLARDADPDVRSVVARFEYIPISVLLLLADDPLTDIRLEVARSLNADERVLRKVMFDSDPQVAQTAEQALQRLREEN